MRKTKSSTELETLVPVNQPFLDRSLRRWPQSVSSAGKISHLAPALETLTSNGDQQLNNLLGSAGVIVWEADLETFQFTHVSDEAAKLVGYEPEQWCQANFLDSHVHPDDRERVIGIRQNHSQASDIEFRMVAKDQHIVWFRYLTAVIDDEARWKRGLMIDITDQKMAKESLRELGGRLISAQEEERSRVARELHDDVNQRIAVLSIQLEQLRQDYQKSVDISQRFQTLQGLAYEISNDVQRLSYKLHPSKLDHLGLGPAVKSLCNELKESGKVQIEFREARVPACISPDVTLCVFRIAQEALRNCITHSGAQVVSVLLEETNNQIHLTVSDNGCGFDPESELTRKGLGFISMRERLRLVDGWMQIHSKPLRGTRVQVSVPLEPEVQQADFNELLPPGKESCDTRPQAITNNRQILTGRWRSHETNTCCTRG